MPELTTLSVAALNALTTNELNGLLMPVSATTGPISPPMMSGSFSPLNVPALFASRFVLLVAMAGLR